MGCYLSSGVDPDDPTVQAYILTSSYERVRGGFRLRNSGCLWAVYVREDKLYLDSCLYGSGYPLTSISKIDIFATTVRICGNDGTVIGFTTSSYHTDEADRFVSQLQAAVDAAKAKSSMLSDYKPPLS